MQFVEHLNSGIPAALSVKLDSRANTGLARCFRLLSGTVQVQRPGYPPIILNRFVPDSSRAGRASERIKRLGSLLGDGLTVSELGKLCEDNIRRNDNFFLDLSNEIAWLLMYQQEKNPVASFIYLYRALEAIAFSFPMIYATKAKDFRLSFEQIKRNFSSKDNVGELAVFKQFVNTISDRELQSIVYRIDVSGLDETSISELEVTLKRICGAQMKGDNPLVAVDRQSGLVSIRFLAMPDFLVSFRNAFVHLLSGSPRNIAANELYDIEDFLEQLVGQGLEFLCTVFLVVCEALSD